MLSPILIIGNSIRYRSLFNALNDLGIRVEQVSLRNVGFTAEAGKPYSALIMDWDLPASDRPVTLEQIRRIWPDLPVLELSIGSDAARISIPGVEKMAHHLAITGADEDDLPSLLESLKRILPELRARIQGARDLLWINTPNTKMKEILALVDILKDEPSSVLIQGENGTGKEVLARLLHFSGRRHSGPFVAINCAAIPETLLESELFGHEKGSFTGATEKRIGKFELSHNGTAFLDEIGDMPLNTQAKILRVLEGAEIERLGGHEKIPVDIRIVAATNKILLEQIEKGYFRRDLYYRINTFTVTVPPLRERREDVLLLARHFLDMQAGRKKLPKKRLSREAEQLLLSHDWPGNVRQLRNAMERAFVLTAGDQIELRVFPEEIRTHAPAPLQHPQPPPIPSPAIELIVPLKDLERQAIINALSQLDNNATRAARELGLSKATFFRKLKQYGISRQRSLPT